MAHQGHGHSHAAGAGDGHGHSHDSSECTPAAAVQDLEAGAQVEALEATRRALAQRVERDKANAAKQRAATIGPVVYQSFPREPILATAVLLCDLTPCRSCRPYGHLSSNASRVALTCSLAGWNPSNTFAAVATLAAYRSCSSSSHRCSQRCLAQGR